MKALRVKTNQRKSSRHAHIIDYNCKTFSLPPKQLQKLLWFFLCCWVNVIKWNQQFLLVCLSHVSYLLLFLVTVLSFECQKFFSDTLDTQIQGQTFLSYRGKEDLWDWRVWEKANWRGGRRKWKINDGKQRKANSTNQKRHICFLWFLVSTLTNSV